MLTTLWRVFIVGWLTILTAMLLVQRDIIREQRATIRTIIATEQSATRTDAELLRRIEAHECLFGWNADYSGVYIGWDGACKELWVRLNEDRRLHRK